MAECVSWHRLAVVCWTVVALLATCSQAEQQQHQQAHGHQEAAAATASTSFRLAWQQGGQQGGSSSSSSSALTAMARRAAQAVTHAGRGVHSLQQQLQHKLTGLQLLLHPDALLAAATRDAAAGGVQGDDAAELRPSHARRLMDSRVGTVGVAIFLILFFMGLCLFICVLGSRTKAPWVVYILSTLVFGIVFAVLAGSPKGPAPVKPPYGYDQTIIPMSIIMGFMCLCIILAGLGMMIYQASPKLYARALSHHVDVLRG